MDLVPPPLSETMRVLGGVRAIATNLGVRVSDRIAINAGNALAGMREAGSSGRGATAWWFEARLMARVRLFSAWQRARAGYQDVSNGVRGWWVR